MKKTVTDKQLDELIKKYKGINGSLEDSESHCNATVWELREGFVTVFSDNSTVSRLVKRCRPYILKVEDNKKGYGCSLWLEASAFRGMEYCFKREQANG